MTFLIAQCVALVEPSRMALVLDWLTTWGVALVLAGVAVVLLVWLVRNWGKK